MRFAPMTAAVGAMAIMLAWLPVNVHAQARPATKVAIANPVKIFDSIQETGDLRKKIESDTKALDAQRMEKQVKLKDLQNQRDALKTDSPQVADLNKQLVQASIEFETWARINQAEMQREQKSQIMALYDKITASVAEVAAKDGIDLVVAEQHPDFPADIDQINVDQLKLLIAQRNVLYASGAVDLTSEVITAMDAKYKAGK